MSRQPDSHESYTVAAGLLHWAAAILALSLLAIVLLVYMWARPVLTAGEQPARPIPPQPRLQQDPAVDIAAERALQRSRLDGYEWMDGTHTVARIPISRAMALLAAKPAPAASTERAR
ncbi:hypothetical protein [Frateuria sp. STR12]|uniref:hypothetical protein n=1 Tax=Frateuria hangzhouensis TaxID=2995589 RepID=UPI002260C017|nr:hypothetical protein [Frateuria sp. STR12]MCX7513260.1 hypothetical protein [Frateuria sp. STR12]